MLFAVAIFLLIWVAFFSQFLLDKFLISTHLLSWLVLIITDEMGFFRALAGVWIIFSAAVFIWVLFNFLLHQSVRGFLKD